ncbi:MAG: hypothetical protein OXF02_01395 [Simkaniaceae bacterium]|nr:hypothetical protein [Simkaniaceae bacterium]
MAHSFVLDSGSGRLRVQDGGSSSHSERSCGVQVMNDCVRQVGKLGEHGNVCAKQIEDLGRQLRDLGRQMRDLENEPGEGGDCDERMRDLERRICDCVDRISDIESRMSGYRRQAEGLERRVGWLHEQNERLRRVGDFEAIDPAE